MNCILTNSIMPTKIKFQDLFFQLNCCVIIPSYNNSSTLRELIEKVGIYTSNIILVNDGSTDDTLKSINNLPDLILISYPVNKGKGYAIRQGFKKALELGYEYAITIDSDLQHDPADFINFLELLQKKPGSLIVGARQMAGVDQPKKSNCKIDPCFEKYAGNRNYKTENSDS